MPKEVKKIKNGELFAMKESFNDLMMLELPTLTGLQVVRLLKAIGNQIDGINEVRNKLILKYGEKQENGNVTLTGPGDPDGKPLSPNWDKFTEEHDELMNGDTVVEFERVVLPKDSKVPVKTLFAFESFIEVAA